jgi:hypothetical protein
MCTAREFLCHCPTLSRNGHTPPCLADLQDGGNCIILRVLRLMPPPIRNKILRSHLRRCPDVYLEAVAREARELALLTARRNRRAVVLAAAERPGYGD